MEVVSKKVHTAPLNAEYIQTPYFHVGRASELSGRDRKLYRTLELVPGLLTWGTLLGTVALSYFAPMAAALFIIAFDLYWLLKTAYLSFHLHHNYKRVKENLATDWSKKLAGLAYEHLYHVILLPFHSESSTVIEDTLLSLSKANYDKRKFIVVLAAEGSGGTDALLRAERAKKKFSAVFENFLITVHPAGIPGELAGKGSNISHATEQVRATILDEQHIPYEHVLVSAFDIDSVIYPDYFNVLSYHFVTHPNPYRTSFQPIPFYNNNIWDVPPLSRVPALSGTFWQMIQQERPEELVTFSSHSVSFKTLYEIGYWQRNIVSDDSRIFWNAFVAYNGAYTVTPMAYPVSMDANLASSFLETCKNVYKQHRRWMWGAENVPYLLFSFIKNKKIPRRKRITTALVQLDGYWALATNPIFIFLLGWLPGVIGGHEFAQSTLAYNLPIITQLLMILAMSGILSSAFIASQFVPRAPEYIKRPKFYRLLMVVEWLLVPFSIIVFGAFPGIEAQTRLLLGKYMGFWVTPKHRGGSNPETGKGGRGNSSFPVEEGSESLSVGNRG